jgi:hypothetical protein
MAVIHGGRRSWLLTIQREQSGGIVGGISSKAPYFGK